MPPDPHHPQSLPRVASSLEEWAASGHHIGAQVYVSRNAEVIADFAMGLARPAQDDAPAIAMTRDTLMLWLSACKPFAAVALAQLRENGLLDFDDPAAKFVPEFAAQGKAAITLAHLLTHTADLRFIDLGWPQASWDQIVATICAMPIEPDWPIGQKAGYSPFASWFILAEVVRRLDGRPYEDYCRQEIFLPLGMTDSWLALPPERYRAYGDRIGIMMNTFKKPPEPAGLDTELAAANCRPGGGARGPARELGRFYAGLLQADRGPPSAATSPPSSSILQGSSVRELTRPHRVGLFDHTFGQTMDWGLGIITSSSHYGEAVPYGYGAKSSPRAFGHGGSQSTCAFADPDRGLVVVITWNGQCGEPAHHRRLKATLAALEEDLA